MPATVVEIGAGTGRTCATTHPERPSSRSSPRPACTPPPAARGAATASTCGSRTRAPSGFPFADSSVDIVVSTLVLCSVDDPRASIAEIHRVLRPGGRFLFLEHVIAPRRGLLRASQRIARRPWSGSSTGVTRAATPRPPSAASAGTASTSNVAAHSIRVLPGEPADLRDRDPMTGALPTVGLLVPPDVLAQPHELRAALPRTSRGRGRRSPRGRRPRLLPRRPRLRRPHPGHRAPGRAASLAGDGRCVPAGAPPPRHSRAQPRLHR